MPKTIAFYLPQYHPIPENDRAWGEGFTEWTNVRKAQPLFKGHDQPRVPGALGYYDLRDAEVREKQVELAKAFGVTGFCYWHYWFNGKRLLERPFNEVLGSGKPDFPFCLGWANESWTGIWHGSPDEIIMEQTYPQGDQDRHFEYLLKAFRDPRYICINEKPLLVLYKPLNIPNPKEYFSYWRKLAVQNGLKGLYILGVNHLDFTSPAELGLDGAIISSLGYVSKSRAVNQIQRRIWGVRRRLPLGSLRVMDYSEACEHLIPAECYEPNNFPCIVPNWDNTPRSGRRGVVLTNSSPQKFKELVAAAKSVAVKKNQGEDLIFLKSWNEWAEGNYMEPDQKWGTSYLEALRDGLSL